MQCEMMCTWKLQADVLSVLQAVLHHFEFARSRRDHRLMPWRDFERIPHKRQHMSHVDTQKTHLLIFFSSSLVLSWSLTCSKAHYRKNTVEGCMQAHPTRINSLTTADNTGVTGQGQWWIEERAGQKWRSMMAMDYMKMYHVHCTYLFLKRVKHCLHRNIIAFAENMSVDKEKHAWHALLLF